MAAIEKHETGGNCEARGGSGERGCLQFLQRTWELWSTEIIGYVAPMTRTNERYVAAHKIQKWLDAGRTEAECALAWNSGGFVHRVGVNSHGIAYNTYEYVRAVMKHL